MEHCENDDVILLIDEVRCVGTPAKQCSAYRTLDLWKLKRSLLDTQEQSIDLTEEALSQTSSPMLIPCRGFVNFGGSRCSLKMDELARTAGREGFDTSARTVLRKTVFLSDSLGCSPMNTCASSS